MSFGDAALPTRSPIPEWPSLYNPVIEVYNLEHHGPVQSNGRYLYNANGIPSALCPCSLDAAWLIATTRADIFRFTFYWALIFHAPLFLFCGFYAFINIAFPPRRFKPPRVRPRTPARPPRAHTLLQPPPSTPPIPIPLTPLSSSSATSPSTLLHHVSQTRITPITTSYPAQPPRLHQQNDRRSQLVHALLVLFTFMVATVGAALAESVIVGYILAGLYHSADFSMSTCVNDFVVVSCRAQA